MSSILVVEGEELISSLLNDELASEEYHTVGVLNGDDAVQFALREVPLLVIFNLSPSAMDSYEAIRRLRSHPKSMHIPIILLSSSSSVTLKVHALEAGVDNYIFNPAPSGPLPLEVVDELLACVRSQLRRAQLCSLSPLTLLPGGLQLERAIDSKLNSADPWSILYLDLDNFKAFNDVYGFLAGNNMILLVGHICQRVVYEDGNTDDFIGHVGGDDFVVVTTPDRSYTLCRNILARYKQESTLLYRQDDLERGTISGVDRKGRPYQFPLVSLSIGVVSSQGRRLHSTDEIGTLVAEAKRHAKQSPGNVFFLSSEYNTTNQYRPHLSFSSSSYAQRQLEPSIFRFMKEDALAEFK
ncbi:MAG: diguanylate cyclase [Ktedonobacteraceae bacterium]|nr:diguanylate cyclase [Ktedonobacteraceae bacterium]